MRNISKEDCPAKGAALKLRQLLLDFGRLRPLRDPLSLFCEELQLTPAQLHTLAWLGHDGALTMGDLARRAGITEKTMTGVVDRMEKLKLVFRLRSSEDRRVVLAQLTDKGHHEFGRLDEAFMAKLTQVMARLTEKDRTALLRIAERIFNFQPLPSRNAQT